MSTKADLQRLALGGELEGPAARRLMGSVVDGELTDLEIAAMLGGLAARGPSAPELAGFAEALAARMIRVPNVPEETIDTCGTGGSGRPTLNTSTLAGVVASAAGASVAKHGNRSASGRCGSLDVLEALGANVDQSPEKESELLRRHRFTFSNARARHPVLARVAGLRRALGFRTVFNLLGPLLSPAGVRRQLLGVSEAALAPVIAGALVHLGRERAWVVAGPGGLDEIGLSGVTEIWRVEGERIEHERLDPSALGLGGDPSHLVGGDVATNARRFLEILEGTGPASARDHVSLNAGAALVVAGCCETVAEGVERARAALASGAARRRFEAWRADTLTIEAAAS